jgi:ABC-type multidrug transport system fused ATPase/permease subunit
MHVLCALFAVVILIGALVVLAHVTLALGVNVALLTSWLFVAFVILADVALAVFVLRALFAFVLSGLVHALAVRAALGTESIYVCSAAVHFTRRVAIALLRLVLTVVTDREGAEHWVLAVSVKAETESVLAVRLRDDVVLSGGLVRALTWLDVNSYNSAISVVVRAGKLTVDGVKSDETLMRCSSAYVRVGSVNTASPDIAPFVAVPVGHFVRAFMGVTTWRHKSATIRETTVPVPVVTVARGCARAAVHSVRLSDGPVERLKAAHFNLLARAVDKLVSDIAFVTVSVRAATDTVCYDVRLATGVLFP